MQAVVGITLLLVAASQVPARRGVVIRLLDQDGNAWRNAQVVLASRAALHGGSPDDDDRVTVRGDGRGRARAEILVGRSYAAYAFSTNAQGDYRSSEIVAPIVAGRAVRLSCSSAKKRTRLRVTGALDLREQGRLRVTFDTVGEQSLVVPDSRFVELPPLPDCPSAVLRVIDERGRVLTEGRVAIAGEEATLRVPTLLPLRVRVVGDKGRPVPAAELIQQAGTRFVSLGVTDGHGMFTGVIPYKRFGRYHFRLQGQCLVRATGYALSMLSYRFDLPRKALADPKQPHLVVRLDPGIRIRGRVWMSKTTPAGGMLLALGGAAWFVDPLGRTRDESFVVPYRWRCARDGSFEIRVDRHCAWRLTALPSRAQLAELAGRGRAVAPFVWFAGEVGGGDDVDLGDIRLDRVPRVTLQIRSDTGQPAAGCEVLVGEAGVANHVAKVVEHPLRASADGTGRVELLVSADSKPAVAASWKGGLGFVKLPKRGPCEVTLDETALVTGSVKGPAGEPLPGVRVEARMSDFDAKGLPHLFARLSRAWEVFSDEHGRYRVRVPGRARYRITARTAAGALMRGARTLRLYIEDTAGVDIPMQAVGGHERGGFEAMIHLFDAGVEKIVASLR